MVVWGELSGLDSIQVLHALSVKNEKIKNKCEMLRFIDKMSFI